MEFELDWVYIHVARCTPTIAGLVSFGMERRASDQKRTGGAPAIDSTHRMVYHAYLLGFDSTHHRMVYHHVYLLVLHPPASIIAAVPPWLVLLYHNNTIYYGVLTPLHRTFQYNNNLFGIPFSAAPLPFFKGDTNKRCC